TGRVLITALSWYHTSCRISSASASLLTCFLMKPRNPLPYEVTVAVILPCFSLVIFHVLDEDLLILCFYRRMNPGNISKKITFLLSLSKTESSYLCTMQVYLDNAATTALDPEVIKAMVEVMEQHYGNPSSIHAHGRQAKTLIEKARKTVAGLLNAAPAEIFFTSGGTEADNMAIVRGIADHGITNAVTSPLEHHAILHTLEALEKSGTVRLNLVQVDGQGRIDLQHLETLLKANPRSFVSLMHANNEIGTLTDIEYVSALCKQYGAVFHSDTVQTVGHYAHDFQRTQLDFA